MSGFLKSVGKVFKKIVKSPIFKAVLIGAAVYFTGGLALGAMGGAVLPGVGTLASTLGITAGSFGAAAAGTVGIAASTISAGALTGAADLAAGGLATEGIGSTIAATAAGGSSLAAAAEAGAGAWMGTGPTAGMAGTLSAAEGAGVTSAASGGWFGSLTSGAKSFFNSTLGQKIAGQAIEMGGKAILGGMQQKAENDRYQQSREDAIRRGYVPDVTSQYAVPSQPARPGNIGTPVVVGGGPMSGIGGGGPDSYRTGYKRPAIVASALQEEDPTKQTAGA